MDCPPIRLDILLKSTTYLKGHPPSPSIANRDFQPDDIVRLVFIHYKLQVALINCGYRCLAHDIAQRFEPNVVHIVDIQGKCGKRPAASFGYMNE